MLLEQGWLVGARRVPSPHYDCRPDDETPTLLVVHNISLPPGEFGGPWIDALFTGTIDPQAHPFFAEIAHLRVSLSSVTIDLLCKAHASVHII